MPAPWPALGARPCCALPACTCNPTKKPKTPCKTPCWPCWPPPPPRGGGPRQGDARGYLFGILKHKITDRLRARYRHGTPPAASATSGGADALDAELFDSRGHWQTGASPALWHDPESQLQNSQFFAVLEACVSKLPPKPARVFSMKELLDCDADEICATLAITRADYWQCMSRARKQLQLCLGQNWFASPPPAPRKERP